MKQRKTKVGGARRGQQEGKKPPGSKELARWLFESYGLPKPVLEWKFHPKRKWQADLAWPELQIAVEIEGGVSGPLLICAACAC